MQELSPVCARNPQIVPHLNGNVPVSPCTPISMTEAFDQSRVVISSCDQICQCDYNVLVDTASNCLIHLVEGMDSSLPIPVVDLSEDVVSAAEKLREACTQHGFFFGRCLNNFPAHSF